MSLQPLHRRLGLADATTIGVGSMLGAGVFAVFAPAAAAAGAGIVVAILIAGLVAFANATSTAQLAAQYPTSGGAYFYGREQLSPLWGFLAGWGFVVGKTASCAAMALTFGVYVAPEAPRAAAAAAIVLLVAVNLRGITRTAQVTRVLVAVTAVVLLIVIVGGATGPAASGSPAAGLPNPFDGGSPNGVLGVLQASGLMFFAFAGYARVATLGEEVRDPERTIPRAIVSALGIVVVVYLTIAVVALRSLGVDALSTSQTPLADVVDAGGGPVWVVSVGAAAACLGALLGLVAGVGRTGMAMARHGDLPRSLALIDPRFGVPYRMELLLAVVLIVLVVTADLRDVISISSFTVLTYYAVANASALTQKQPARRYPRMLAITGLVGCVVLAFTLPPFTVVGGVTLLLLGFAGRAVVIRRRQRL